MKMIEIGDICSLSNIIPMEMPQGIKKHSMKISVKKVNSGAYGVHSPETGSIIINNMLYLSVLIYVSNPVKGALLYAQAW